MPNDKQLQRILEVLCPLAESLPIGLNSKFRGDHLEVMISAKPQWLILNPSLNDGQPNEKMEAFQRTTLLLDLAEAVCKLKDEGLLEIAN